MRKRELILPILLLALLLGSVGVGAKLYIDHAATEAALRGKLDAAESSAAVESAQAEAELAALRAELEVELEAIRADRDATAAALAALEEKLSGARDDALLLEGEREDLVEQIAILRVNLATRDETIAALEADIARYNHVYSIDVRAQADAIHEIITMLEEGAPLVRIAKLDDEDKPVEPPTDREVVEEDEKYYYVYPHLALYYEDLTTGYHLAYGENETFYSASLIKAPYMMWLLETISQKEVEAIAAAETAATETTVPDETTVAPETTVSPETTAKPTDDETTAPAETTKLPKLAEPYPEREAMLFADEKYDLSRVFTYTEAGKREGSGSIQHESYGSEYTYRELCELAIRKSDNVAFWELRQVFGYSDFWSFNTRLGVNSVRNNFNSITAADMATYLRYMYNFIETDARYGAEFKSWLMNSAHSVMIPYAVHPTKVAHKYGWDEEAYHDAGIVYHENPYLLVVLTDLDDGTNEVNEYIRTLVKKVNALHQGFYK